MSSGESESPSTSSGPSDFFNFRSFISPALVKFLYVLWSIVIVLVYPISVIAAFTNGARAGVVAIVAGFIGTIIGLLFARILCETMIVLFRIYEELRDRKV